MQSFVLFICFCFSIKHAKKYYNIRDMFQFKVKNNKSIHNHFKETVENDARCNNKICCFQIYYS